MDSVTSYHQGEALAHLVKCFEQHQWDYVLIGATALVVHGIDIGRSTLDLDFVILLNIDEVLDRNLIKCGLEHTQLPHRYQWKRTMIDIIPISKNPQKDFIDWPTGERMSIIGFREAVEQTSVLEVPIATKKISIKVAPIPLIVFLKLIACAERMESGDHDYARKHWGDIVTCLKQYESNSSRRFEYLKEMSGVKDEFECAGAFLIGLDLRKLASEKMLSLFNTILNRCYIPKMGDIDKMLFECMRRGFSYEG